MISGSPPTPPGGLIPLPPPAAPARTAPAALGPRLRRRVWTTLEEGTAGALAKVRAAPGAFGARGARGLNRLGTIDPARLLGLVARARRVAPGNAFLAQAEAMMVARTRGWEAAAPLFEAEAARRAPAAAVSLLRRRPDPAIWPVLPATERPSFITPAEAARFVVYTTAFGAEPAPAPLFQEPAGPRFLLLTDRADLAVAGWESHVIVPPVAPELAGAWARILPGAALAGVAPEAEGSLCLRHDRVLIGNPHTMALRWLLPCDFALWRHGGGIDWHDLAERHLIGAGRAGAASPAEVLAQARDCAARGIPPERGAFDTGLIWRRHHAPEVARVMEAWWETHARAPGLEEISLYATLNDPARPWSGAAPERAASDRRPDPARALPAALGTATLNAFAARRFPKPPLRPKDPEARQPDPGAPAAPITGSVTGRPLGVAFLYAEQFANSASTILRGKQLAEMVAARYPEALDIAYTSDIAALRDQVVVVTKGALDVHSAETLDALRRRNRAVIGSWDDRLPTADKIAATDAIMGVSNRQTHDFAKLFPETRAYHVTHHVNSGVKASIPPRDKLRTAYFGFHANTILPESLRNMVDMIPLETSKVDMSWIDLLPWYNCHWIVRRSKAHDGWKPFLKGFTAARVGAVLVVGRGDEDALQYLGDDYPFYIGGSGIGQLEYDMARVAAAFGGPDWRLARDIMAQVADRSSDAQVCAEFRAMVEDVIA